MGTVANFDNLRVAARDLFQHSQVPHLDPHSFRIPEYEWFVALRRSKQLYSVQRGN